MRLRIAKWAEYQHYGKRCPPWIKLHNTMLTSPTWVVLDDAGRVLAIACMLLASRDRAGNGEFDAAPEYVRRVAYLNQAPDFAPLLKVGFLEAVDRPATTPPPPCPPPPRVETETETEARAREDAIKALASREQTAMRVLDLLKSTGKWSHRDNGVTALAEVGRLVGEHGADATMEEAQWYSEHHREKYAPAIVGLRSLGEWGKIRAAMDRATASALPDNNAGEPNI
jgi:hypothetical protein